MIRTIFFKKPIAYIVIFALTSCAVEQEYHHETATQLGIPNDYVSPRASLASGDMVAWWNQFNDPILTQLMTQALSENLSLAEASARLKQARESLVQSHAQQQPSVTTSGSAGRNFGKSNQDSNSFAAEIDASWNTDLFGQLRNGTLASGAALQASVFDLASVRTSLVAELARNYVDARVYTARIEIALNTLNTQDDNLEITIFRRQAGLVSSLDVEQARAQRSQTAATIPTLNKSLAAARNRLALLTAKAPGAVDSLFKNQAIIPVADDNLTIGIPANVLRQRPDVRKAEQNLISATAKIGVAKANLYPSLTLTGNLSLASTSMSTLTDFITGNLFANVAYTIFDGGNLRSVVRNREAVEEEYFASYKAVILTALEDIENGAVALDAAKLRVKELGIQVEASNNAAIIARNNYRAGLSDFQTLLDNERTLLSARDSFASAKGDVATAIIQLYLALGGGWDTNNHIKEKV